MSILTIPTKPIAGQKPGTSGLRQKTQVFQSPNYLENFIQSVWNGLGGVEGKTLVLGGDGRHFNVEAIRIVLRMAAAAGAARVIVGQGGILSTPAASHLIRLHGADGGLLLSASHNPGGPSGDFGVKYNIANGGPAPESITAAIYEASQCLGEYHIHEADAPDLEVLGECRLGGTVVKIVDPVEDYVALMARLFDFGALRALFASGFTMRFDAMNAVTGPYARALFEQALGAPVGTVVNACPLPDFGGLHPDPNPVWAKALMDEMMGAAAPDFGAASDGDGDRNMITGRGIYITPSDSLAVIAANAHLVPAYAGGLAGVARSMPTSRALDRVAKALGLACHETPTGWKFFGNLLDDGRVRLCGEESAGTGSDHIREKDGLWAVLMWLSILAARSMSVADIMHDHWVRYGRNYYARHDYEALDKDVAQALMADLRARLPDLAGAQAGKLTIAVADEFAYDDPVDASHSAAQGLRITFNGGGRAVLRLSGTGTQGATLRLYLEQLAQDHDRPVAQTLEDVRIAAETLAGIHSRTGRDGPDVIT